MSRAIRGVRGTHPHSTLIRDRPCGDESDLNSCRRRFGRRTADDRDCEQAVDNRGNPVSIGRSKRDSTCLIQRVSSDVDKHVDYSVRPSLNHTQQLQQSVQIVGGVELDSELSFPLPLCHERDIGLRPRRRFSSTQLTSAGRSSGFWVGRELELRVSAPPDDRPRWPEPKGRAPPLLARAWWRARGSASASSGRRVQRELSILQQLRTAAGSCEHAQQIRDRRAVLPDQISDLVLSEREVTYQTRVTFCLFDRIQILALQILHEREGEHCSIVVVVDYGGDLGHPAREPRATCARPRRARSRHRSSGRLLAGVVRRRECFLQLVELLLTRTPCAAETCSRVSTPPESLSARSSPSRRPPGRRQSARYPAPPAFRAMHRVRGPVVGAFVVIHSLRFRCLSDQFWKYAP